MKITTIGPKEKKPRFSSQNSRAMQPSSIVISSSKPTLRGKTPGLHKVGGLTSPPQDATAASYFPSGWRPTGWLDRRPCRLASRSLEGHGTLRSVGCGGSQNCFQSTTSFWCICTRLCRNAQGGYCGSTLRKSLDRATPKPLKTCPGPVGCRTALLCAGSQHYFPFPWGNAPLTLLNSYRKINCRASPGPDLQ